MANHIKITNPFKILLRIPADIVGKLDKFALDAKTSRNEIILEAINSFLKSKK